MDEPKPGQSILKVIVADKVKAEGEGKFAFTVSTGKVDRDHDTISPDGWDLKNYRKNPVVLFAHDSSQPPIGKAENIRIEGSALRARVAFPEKGTYELADTVRGLVEQDILKATSVGFIPTKWAFDEERGGFDFLEQELYEFSIVPIPSNPDALRDSKSMDLGPLVPWLEFAMESAKGPGLWLPKDVAEKALKVATGDPVSVTVPAAGGEVPAEAHALGEPGSTPGPATPDPENEPPKKRTVLRLVKGRSNSFTREQLEAAVQSAVMDAARAVVRHASGRLD